MKIVIEIQETAPGYLSVNIDSEGVNPASPKERLYAGAIGALLRAELPNIGKALGSGQPEFVNRLPSAQPAKN